MSLVIALILGLIQGLTEFFPVSSSAHLKLAGHLLGVEALPPAFDLACHLGTLMALLWFFREEIQTLFTTERQTLVYLSIALVPLLPGYFLFRFLSRWLLHPNLLGLFLILTGGLLLLATKVRIRRPGSALRAVFLIGAVQAAALIPGISRSASTISLAQMLGWQTKKAVRFSFLLAIPTITGGSLFEAGKLWREGLLAQSVSSACLIGFATAFVVGATTIRFALSTLEGGRLSPFGWYCIALGALTSFCFLARISHQDVRKGERDVSSGFVNREAANMRLHIGNEWVVKDDRTDCLDSP